MQSANKNNLSSQIDLPLENSSTFPMLEILNFKMAAEILDLELGIFLGFGIYLDFGFIEKIKLARIPLSLNSAIL